MAELSPQTKKLMDVYAVWQTSQNALQQKVTIHVDEVALRVAAFYEQVRTIVDWKEEHLMRRAAIIRKLKRRFLDLELNGNLPADVAEALVLELIRGGYFPNDKIEESIIIDVQKIIDKYVFILKNGPANENKHERLNFYNWFLEVAACEIEETLAPSVKEIALIDYMVVSMKERIRVSEKVYEKKLLERKDTDVQIFIAVQRSLFKLDSPIISYNLIKYKYPMWTNPSEEYLLEFSHHMPDVWQDIEKDLACPVGKKFYTVCEKYDTAYLLVGDILSKETNKNIDNPPALEEYTKIAYVKRLADLKNKITRAAVYSTLSIFISKILLLFILEVVLAKVLGEALNTAILIMDILIPTLLMATLVITVRPPSKKNINLVIVEVIKLVYQTEKADTYDIKLARKKGVITRTFLSFTYLIGACISFGGIYVILHYFGFPLSSIVVNIIFIALILFAGTAIQKRSQELTIEANEGGVLMFASDILFLPVTGMGRWMSNKWKKYNAITAFFNILIDIPFSVFVEFIEGWRNFIRERKEEL